MGTDESGSTGDETAHRAESTHALSLLPIAVDARTGVYPGLVPARGTFRSTRAFGAAIRAWVLLNRFLLGVAMFLVALIEVPVFLLRNRRVLRNDLVTVFWHWSFGHGVSGLDYLSRLYHPHRIGVIFVPNPRSNPLLPYCFTNFDAAVFRGIVPPRPGIGDRSRYRVLRFTVLLLSAFGRRFDVVDFMTAYRTLSLAKEPLLVGREPDGRLEPTTDYTGYIRLLRDEVGDRPRLPDEEERRVREAIGRKFPAFFERPFVTLLLRGEVENRLDSAFRAAGPHANYRPAVEHATRSGYQVAGTGETEHAEFRDVDGYFDLGGVEADHRALNLFLLSRCALFVGQQSGSIVFANSSGVPVLLCDALPHRLGTFRQSDLVLFKHLVDTDGRRLTLEEIYLERAPLAFGGGFTDTDVTIEPNDPDEIREALAESLALLEGTLELAPEDLERWERLREVWNPSMTIAYQGNRPPLSMLRTVSRSGRALDPRRAP
jgi:putative glycosyltransferase (TIGR04372 family)